MFTAQEHTAICHLLAVLLMLSVIQTPRMVSSVMQINVVFWLICGRKKS